MAINLSTLSGSSVAGQIGATGPIGVQGSTGPQGASGIQGGEGPHGASGATGTQGASGSTGLTGATGIGIVGASFWTITELSGELFFAVNGVNKAKLDSSGNLSVVGDVIAYETIA